MGTARGSALAWLYRSRLPSLQVVEALGHGCETVRHQRVPGLLLKEPAEWPSLRRAHRVSCAIFATSRQKAVPLTLSGALPARWRFQRSESISCAQPAGEEREDGLYG